MSKQSLITQAEFEAFIKRWAFIKRGTSFKATQAATTLMAEMAAIQPELIDLYRHNLNHAYMFLGWAAYESNEVEFKRGLELVWLAKFSLMVAERKAEKHRTK